MSKLRRPLFKYFGSKWFLTKHYPKPNFDKLIEPFAGSACYSLQNYEREVILYEKDPKIAGLWQWLITAPSDIISSLPSFRGEDGLNIRDWAVVEGLPWQAGELVIRWQRVGRSDCPTVSKWNCKPGQWMESTRDYLAEAVQHIKHWQCYEDDYTKSIIHADSKTTAFIDPPYQMQPLAVYGAGVPIDYNQLAKFCQLDWGQSIVCEQSGASWLPFNHLREAVVKGHGGKSHSKYNEVYWCN